MSLQAPKSFWDKRILIDYMNEDSISTIMKMSKDEITLRINCVDLVLGNHDKAIGVLDGKLSDEFRKTIITYKDMLKVVQKDPPQTDIPLNSKLGLGMDGGIRSYIS